LENLAQLIKTILLKQKKFPISLSKSSEISPPKNKKLDAFICVGWSLKMGVF
jgi:hypothetical protein